MSNPMLDLEKLNKKLTAARAARQTLETKGWREVGQLILDKLIIDSIGGKVGNEWKPGLLSKPDSVDKREYLVGYKQALIDFNNRMWAYVESIPMIEEQIKQLEKRETEKGKLQQPFSSSPYAHDGAKR